MTTISMNVRPLSPGAVDAQESQNDTGSAKNLEVNQFQEPLELEYPFERPPQDLSGENAGVLPELASAAHVQIAIGSLLDNRLRMRESLTLEMEQEGEFYIAKCENLHEFGYGEDPITAVQDIRNTLAELYWELKENQDRLGSDLAETWRKLSALVYEA